MKTAKSDWNADDYAKNSSAQLQWAQELIAKIELKGTETILDIGCGDGKISAGLAQIVKDGQVIAVDSSESMIQRAREQFPQHLYTNLTFIPMDATAIALSEKVDLAFSNATLHWVKNQKVVLQGVRNVLKSGGRVFFQMGGKGNASEIFAVIEKIVALPQWYKYFEDFKTPYYFYSADDYRPWLLETGFHPVRVELIQKIMEQKGIDGLLGWLRTTWFPYTDCLPLELREVFLEEVTTMFAADHPVDKSGILHVKMVRLEVEASFSYI